MPKCGVYIHAFVATVQGELDWWLHALITNWIQTAVSNGREGLVGMVTHSYCKCKLDVQTWSFVL